MKLSSSSLKPKTCEEIYLPSWTGAEAASSTLTSYSTQTYAITKFPVFLRCKSNKYDFNNVRPESFALTKNTSQVQQCDYMRIDIFKTYVHFLILFLNWWILLHWKASHQSYLLKKINSIHFSHQSKENFLKKCYSRFVTLTSAQSRSVKWGQALKLTSHQLHCSLAIIYNW